jgi:Ricin-type beta-trefoil lectin domain
MEKEIRFVSLVGVGVLAVALLGARAASAAVTADDSFFHTSPLDGSGIGAKRGQIINFIWGSAGFPNTKLPSLHKFVPSPISGLTNLQSVEALRITMDAGEYSIGYHFLPATGRRNRLVVVHQGHACDLVSGGIQNTIAALVADGFGVLAMSMPRFSPANPNIPDPGNCNAGDHPSMFNLPLSGGNALKFFMEPVAVGINYLVSRVGYTDINMVGLSGGGWTTTLYPALDTRIASSFPVAGSVPLYLRVEPYPHDLEQFFDPFYGASGVAGYLDLYLLGSRGTGRRQIQILNRHDSCCFGEGQHNAAALGIGFEPAVRIYESRLKSVAAGTAGLFRTMIDEVSPVHMISDYAIQNVILPVLRNTAVAATLPTTIRSRYGIAGNLCIDIPDLGRLPQNGDPVQVFQCHGGINQEFAIQNDGTIRVQRGGLCLDVPNFGRPPQNGDQLQVFGCHGGINQQFDAMADGTVRSRWTGGLCLDVPVLGREPQNGDRLQVFGCHGGVNQQFSVDKPTTTMSSKWGPSLCVDLPDFGRPPQDHDFVQVFTCHGGPNQRFNLESDGTFRSESGALCLDIPEVGRPPQNGDQLQVFHCNGGLNQQFDVQADSSVKSRATNGLCLDIPEVGRPPQSFDRLQVFQCHGGINQQFNINR